MAAYDASLLSYWSQQEQKVTPSCILSPNGAQDVSKALRILSQYQAAGNSTTAGCQFAIRGAGHTPWAGSANIDKGVTIDMRAINAVKVDHSKTVVSVGAGARWSDVYTKLDAIGLAVAGGRNSDVGVGGLITGGGMSYFAPRYGFVCDQVLNFEVALADGQIVNANATSNPDLWFALKGGSNNFGIVTRFDLKAFHQGKIWGGSIYNPITTLPDQINAFVGLNNATSYDPNAALINTYGYTSQMGSWVVTNLLVYTKRQVNPPVLRPFTDIKPQLGSTMRLTNLSDVTYEQVNSTPYGLRQLFLTRTYGNDPTFLTRVFHIANATLTHSFSHVPGLIYALVYQPLPSIITSHSATSGGNPLGLSDNNSSSPQVLALQTIQWSNAADDALINAAARTIWTQADVLAREMGMMRKWRYLNYAAQDQDPLGSYGEENLARLRAVSGKFDPRGMFQRNVPGGFKLVKAGGDGTTVGVA
ncbi:MAG: hypothetical protein LQ338_004098 [Usnochroma carphineum]|nr:MAG: hypothetical protein LQ338_004098 [Usnochroma carphineum]